MAAKLIVSCFCPTTAKQLDWWFVENAFLCFIPLTGVAKQYPIVSFGHYWVAVVHCFLGVFRAIVDARWWESRIQLCLQCGRVLLNAVTSGSTLDGLWTELWSILCYIGSASLQRHRQLEEGEHLDNNSRRIGNGFIKLKASWLLKQIDECVCISSIVFQN